MEIPTMVYKGSKIIWKIAYTEGEYEVLKANGWTDHWETGETKIEIKPISEPVTEVKPFPIEDMIKSKKRKK